MDIVHNNKIYSSDQMKAVDQFLEKMSKIPMWEGIEFLVTVFLNKHPEYKNKVQESHKNEFAATDDLGMRHLARIPDSLSDLLDYFYRDDIGVDKKRFYREFVKRFPVFAVPDKI